ncbi:MAG TPA: hypothetical protein VNW92_19910, partial [Polyangiaceae bacterium]|nr:hypothetical protein [Polyangiaceae bacterium]
DAGTPPPTPTPALVAAPQDECGSTCRENFQLCTRPCDPDAGKPDPACKACDPDYKACMKRCFQ